MKRIALSLRLVALATGLTVGVSGLAGEPWVPLPNDTIVNTHGHGPVRVSRSALGTLHASNQHLTYTADWDCGVMGYGSICAPVIESLGTGLRIVRLNADECEVRERLLLGIDLLAAGHLVSQKPRITSYTWVTSC